MVENASRKVSATSFAGQQLATPDLKAMSAE